MLDWTQGYVTQVQYVEGFYPETAPLRVKLALRNAGFKPPLIKTACELGCGMGTNLLTLAAANPKIEWYGNDFNPSHILNAQRIQEQVTATVGHTNLHLSHCSFAEYLEDTNLPDFDYIILHGVWSWISDNDRALITKFIQRKLTLGGVVYLGYNALPGWSAFTPIRQLLHQVFNRSSGTVADRATAALAFCTKFFASQPHYAGPTVQDFLNKITKEDQHYVLHEYLNEHWTPLYFSQVNQQLNQAKLTFACSANLLANLDAVSYTQEVLDVFKQQPLDQELKEELKCYASNELYRRDLWLKGALSLTKNEQDEEIRQQTFVLTSLNPALTDVQGLMLTNRLDPSIYRPVLAHCQQVTSAEDLSLATQLPLDQVNQALTILTHMGLVSPCQNQRTLNAHAYNQALYYANQFQHKDRWLASPVTGNGQLVSWLDQALLQRDLNSVQDNVDYLWSLMQENQEVLVKDGMALASSKENRDELTVYVQNFLTRARRLYLLLGIV